jgi:hypothetical protein
VWIVGCPWSAVSCAVRLSRWPRGRTRGAGRTEGQAESWCQGHRRSWEQRASSTIRGGNHDLVLSARSAVFVTTGAFVVSLTQEDRRSPADDRRAEDRTDLRFPLVAAGTPNRCAPLVAAAYHGELIEHYDLVSGRRGRGFKSRHPDAVMSQDIPDGRTQ